MKPRLNREVFTTSRLLEFCSRKELELQSGHTPDQWPLVVGKELGDNVLDASEDQEGVQPELSFTVTTGARPSITVADNGPGIAPETVSAILPGHRAKRLTWPR
jgi:DNA topoisomerase VI subunit B